MLLSVADAASCPVGTNENSPAIHCWGTSSHQPLSPVGTAEIKLQAARLSRPYGTQGMVFAYPIPRDKSLGYFH